MPMGLAGSRYLRIRRSSSSRPAEWCSPCFCVTSSPKIFRLIRQGSEGQPLLWLTMCVQRTKWINSSTKRWQQAPRFLSQREKRLGEATQATLRIPMGLPGKWPGIQDGDWRRTAVWRSVEPHWDRRQRSKALHLEGERIALNQRGHLIVGKRHVHDDAVPARCNACLSEQLRHIGIFRL